MTFPTITVVVPTYSRPETLSACLEALARLDYPRDRFDVIVVDDGSPAPVELSAKTAALGLRLQLQRQMNRGPAAARNLGARAACSEMVAFIDDDCEPHPGWLRALAEAYMQTPEALLGGRTKNGLPGNAYATTTQQLLDLLHLHLEATRGVPVFFASNNMALARDRFLACGGFDESFPMAAAEDRELCDRWRHLGAPLRFVAVAEVEHRHNLDLRGFWQQHWNYGRGAYQFDCALRRTHRPTRSLEPASFYARLLLHPLRAGGSRGRWRMWGLMVLSQVATAAGYFTERHRR